METFEVDFQPVGRRGDCRRDESLMACARSLGVGLSSVCGGQGTCHSCRVQVLDGTVSEITDDEKAFFSAAEIKKGWRLACQTCPRSDVKLSVPAESMTAPQRVQVEGLEIVVTPEPPVKAYRVQMEPPSLSATQADDDRLLEALNQQQGLDCRRIDIDVMRGLSTQVRSGQWQCQAAVRQDEVIAVSKWPGRLLGLAVDLGTTKIAGYLVDLEDGRTLAAGGVMNPQISYGEDIISRISGAVASPEKAVHLRQMVAGALDGLAQDLCAGAGVDKSDIVEAVVVGNTAMHHLFLGLPLEQLASTPFIPAVNRAVDIKARDLGLHLSPGAYVHLLPNIAGFVGADHVAMLLATEVWKEAVPVLALDIGTNTEVSLVNKGRISSVSCASGPAFEGGHIRDGMRAASGAIEHLRITADGVQYQTVDEAPPAGICGSGILDAMSQLYRAGIIDEGGRMTDGHRRVRTIRRQRQFVLVSREERDGRPAIAITQADVRELQLAKAAIRTGIQALLEAGGCSEEAIQQVVIAGAFGTYIDVASAVDIGMLPALPPERFRQVGNAAGAGSRLALVSLSKRFEAREIASRVSYIELAGTPDFTRNFMLAGYLGRYRIVNGEREVIKT